MFVLLTLTSITVDAKTALVGASRNDDYVAITASNKGIELYEKGDYAGARACFDAALRKDPRAWLIYYNRANVSVHEKQWQLVLQDCNSCIKYKPSFFMAVILRASANQHLGNYSSSLADYNRILSLHPLPGAQALALNDRAWLQATCPNASIRNPQQAISDAKAACNVSSWGNAGYIDTLAVAYAEAGNFDDALKFEEKAISQSHDADKSKNMQQRLAMFRQHRIH
ncbi:MAG: hypothetical protein QOH39_2510 [Verrucomicrobiota bacterium]|jgi:serine/threonine-protein kinase